MAQSDKGSFRFVYTRPSLDWFETVNVEIKPDDYYYFKLERRFGPNWWLIGKNPPPENSTHYEWSETDIGRISHRDIARFIDWAKFDGGGSKLVEISAISGSFDILKEIENLLSNISGFAAETRKEDFGHG